MPRQDTSEQYPTFGPQELSGPFLDVITQPRKIDSDVYGGSTGNVGLISHVFTKFNEGASEARRQKFFEEERRKQLDHDMVEKSYQSAMNNPRLDPEAKNKITERYQNWAAQMLHGEANKNAKSHPKAALFSAILNSVMGGPPVKTAKYDDPVDVMRDIHGIASDPRYSIPEQQTAVRRDIGAIVSGLREKLGYEPNRRQVAAAITQEKPELLTRANELRVPFEEVMAGIRPEDPDLLGEQMRQYMDRRPAPPPETGQTAAPPAAGGPMLASPPAAQSGQPGLASSLLGGGYLDSQPPAAQIPQAASQPSAPQQGQQVPGTNGMTFLTEGAMLLPDSRQGMHPLFASMSNDALLLARQKYPYKPAVLVDMTNKYEPKHLSVLIDPLRIDGLPVDLSTKRPIMYDPRRYDMQANSPRPEERPDPVVWFYKKGVDPRITDARGQVVQMRLSEGNREGLTPYNQTEAQGASIRQVSRERNALVGDLTEKQKLEIDGERMAVNLMAAHAKKKADGTDDVDATVAAARQAAVMAGNPVAVEFLDRTHRTWKSGKGQRSYLEVIQSLRTANQANRQSKQIGALISDPSAITNFLGGGAPAGAAGAAAADQF